MGEDNEILKGKQIVEQTLRNLAEDQGLDPTYRWDKKSGDLLALPPAIGPATSDLYRFWVSVGARHVSLDFFADQLVSCNRNK